jgi:predicted short-subunit dehydrogenase-like oxidoreductase (DUF2520 family)
MNYTIIGTGNVAWFLADRLKKAGSRCQGVYGRNKEEALKLCEFTKAPLLVNLRDIHDQTDCCIIAVPDHAVTEISRRLEFVNTVLVHTAGSLSLGALDGSKHRGVIWMIYSILKNNLPDHRQIPCAWEGNTDQAREIVEKLAREISDLTYEADEQQRLWLHLTAVVGNNFTNHLMAICDKICAERNIPSEMIRPILEQTFKRAMESSPALSQTGPAIRRDITTMNRHLDLLTDRPDWAAIYQALSLSIDKMYHGEA